MSDIFEEYKDYYRVRAERYANNPNYRNSYEAEKNLCDAFLNCSQMEEFRSKASLLSFKCASALTKDKYIMEQAFYNEIQETVRINASKRILAMIDRYDNVMDLITMVNEELNKNNIEISMDEANRQFHADWEWIDNIEVYENAVVPDEHKQDMINTANWYKKTIVDSVINLEEQNSHWQTGWKLNPDVILEYRHQRLLPYKDEHITEQLKKYKSIINR